MTSSPAADDTDAGEARPTRRVALDGSRLGIFDVIAVARDGARVEIAPRGRELLDESRGGLERALARGEPIYGVNTGFGSLSRQRIADDELAEVQRNLLRSHAAGVGPPLPDDVVRGMLLLLAASLTRGRSGVRPELVQAIVDLLNAGITPVVPETGSVGASGDLAPLAHATLALIGEGEVVGPEGTRLPAAEALSRAGLDPIELEAKEGLALINGTHLMAARGCLLLDDVERLLGASVAACAISIDACRASHAFLDPRVHAVRGQAGQIRVAEALGGLLVGSEIRDSHRTDDPRVQDPYSLRCAPQVLGAVSDTLGWVRSAISRELGAVTDNPLVFAGEEEDDVDVISAGNFHGMPLAIPLDALAIAIAHLAGISERRIYLMLAAQDPEAHLTAYLSPRPGLHSGYMIAQYTAAACCNEIIQLAGPSSVANLPTSAGMEDYNSFGPAAAKKARRALDLAESVVSIELMCAVQALEAHRPLRSGEGVEAARDAVRAVVEPLLADRSPAPDIAAVTALIRRGAFPRVAHSA
ncbi:MAG: histidine ammonia-lyase [Longimicrobiales bacterium]|nr:histidine ammonia-lyase [Longimicrobiales bacterium]